MAFESASDLAGMFDTADFAVSATWWPDWARAYGRELALDAVANTYGLTVDTAALAVLYDLPIDTTGGLGQGRNTRRREVLAPLAAFPLPPLRNDTLAIGAATFRVEAATAEADAAVHRLVLAE